MTNLLLKKYRKQIAELESENKKLKSQLQLYNEKGLAQLVDETLKMKKEYEDLISANLEIRAEYEKILSQQNMLYRQYHDAVIEIQKDISR